MFLLGILAIIQIVFLPGLIFNRLYRIQGGFFFRLSSIFATSLILNFLAVYGLALLKIYTRPVFLVLVILEFFALIWLYRSDFKVNLDQWAEKITNSKDDIIADIKQLFSAQQFSPAMLLLRQTLQAVILGVAVSLVIWFVRRLTNSFGTVFNTWDAVVAWNTWAQIWATNQIPNQTGMYPQLLPANLSITYLLTANAEVVMFAKAIMPLFSIMIILTLFELAVVQKRIGYFIAIIISYLMLKKFTGDILTDGYADIPVTFMVFMAFIPIFRNPDLLLNKNEFILGGIFTAGAALTKQVGIYCLGIYPVIALLTTSKLNKEKVKNALFCFSIAALIAIVWYMPKLILIMKDFTNSNLAALTDVAAHTYQDVSTSKRMFLAFTGLGKYLAVYLITIPFLFLLKKRFRLVVALFILPFSILWSIIASYDPRNLAITFPIVAVVVGLGLDKLMDLVLILFSRIKTGKVWAVSLIGFIFLFVIGASFLFSDQEIISAQREKQKQIFSPEINEQIYSLPFDQGGCSKIITNYPVMYLPGLEDNQVNSYFSDYGVYQILIKDPSSCWMLVPNYAEDSIKREIQSKLGSGEYTLLFETKKWVPYMLVQIK
ncbi:MAG: Uncharacterized protein FD147_1570 [Chloroflexi bacterium]|nr:MAG: Uncharacterized protein FD147_1570 [Chloroflexota bacterium]